MTFVMTSPFPAGKAPVSHCERVRYARYRVRTCDPYRVKVVRFRGEFTLFGSHSSSKRQDSIPCCSLGWRTFSGGYECSVHGKSVESEPEHLEKTYLACWGFASSPVRIRAACNDLGFALNPIAIKHWLVAVKSEVRL